MKQLKRLLENSGVVVKVFDDCPSNFEFVFNSSNFEIMCKIRESIYNAYTNEINATK